MIASVAASFFTVLGIFLHAEKAMDRKRRKYFFFVKEIPLLFLEVFSCISVRYL